MAKQQDILLYKFFVVDKSHTTVDTYNEETSGGGISQTNFR
jgi:hypothetical protein